MKRLPGIVVIGLLLVAAGCARQQRNGLYDKLEPDVSKGELGARLVQFGELYVGRVERLAGEIYRESDDPDVRRRAIVWAIRTNEEVVRAAFYRDPMAALVDLWAMAAQMSEFADRSMGLGTVPEPYAARIVAMNGELADRIEAIAMEYGGDNVRARGHEIIEQWVAEHPLTGDLSRASTAPLIARMTPDYKPDVFDTLEDMNESVVDIGYRLDIMNSQLPKQLMWRSALLVEEFLLSLGVPELAARSAEALALVEDLPEVIEKERAAVMADIDRQRVETLADLDRQRVEMFAEIDRQREETIASFESMTRETFEMIDAQRVAIDGAIEKTTDTISRTIGVERSAAIDQVQAMLGDSVIETEDATDLVDHLAVRVLQLGGAAFLAAVILVILLTRLWPRP